MWPDMRMPFQTRAGQADWPIEPGLADVVGAVGDRAATEVVALHGARETLALRRAGDLDVIARAERLDGDGIADREVRLAPELFEMAVETDARLCEVAGLRLVQVLGLGLAERELDRVIAVGAVALHLDHRARTSFDHRDGQYDAVFGEQLGHPHLLADDCLHCEL